MAKSTESWTPRTSWVWSRGKTTQQNGKTLRPSRVCPTKVRCMAATTRRAFFAPFAVTVRR